MPTPELAVVHPLVLLSVVDHYNRVAKDTKKRVVGVLLGENSKGRIDITNSFAGMPAMLQDPLHQLTWFVMGSVLVIGKMVMLTFDTVQSHMKRMTGIQRFGSWITAISKTCAPCSRR